MNMLIIDSSSEKLLVIATTEGKSAAKISNDESKRHNSLLLPFIDDVLDELSIIIKDIDYIACIVGAGSFTGIRLGVTTANALAKGINAKLISMNAFEVLAYNVKGMVLALVDAKHSNYYGGVFNNGNALEIGNYTNEDIINFKGTVIIRDNEFLIDNYIKVALSKIDDTVDYLMPLYLKKSQAERELECRLEK